MANNWDLAELLVEREQPETDVTIYVSEMASYAKTQLLKEYQATHLTAEEINALDARMGEIDTELEKVKYTFHISAIPQRRQEDISSKNLAEHPYINGGAGETPESSKNRVDDLNARLWQAQIKWIDNPAGERNEDFTVDDMRNLATAMPVAVQNAVDEAIREINVEANQYVVKKKDPLF